MLKNSVGEDEGFIRLTIEEVKDDLMDAIAQVMLNRSRIVLLQAGEEVAAIVPIDEFERLDYLLEWIKPSQFTPCEEEYYENEGGIRCLRIDEFQDDFYDIVADVLGYGQLFGFLPPANLGGKEFDIFIPMAILMPIDNFWIPEYFIAAAKNKV
ncbi:type II toxin-antitoxin system Phd/YefM family antitoxin [Aerosakkonema sp. BLCC-F183]|uniref:type II toxin-antitoxin system Phd/YefM family antitoxin n=1 Tax=Aerosakkonema sp. BLCC-F183 TaxID=3342834 RepID=UPI0035B97261